MNVILQVYSCCIFDLIKLKTVVNWIHDLFILIELCYGYCHLTTIEINIIPMPNHVNLQTVLCDVPVHADPLYLKRLLDLHASDEFFETCYWSLLKTVFTKKVSARRFNMNSFMKISSPLSWGCRFLGIYKCSLFVWKGGLWFHWLSGLMSQWCKVWRDVRVLNCLYFVTIDDFGF